MIYIPFIGFFVALDDYWKAYSACQSAPNELRSCMAVAESRFGIAALITGLFCVLMMVVMELVRRAILRVGEK